MVTEAIPANPKVMKEALELSETILSDIEAGEIPVSRMALKARRLAYILKDAVFQKILDYEVNGYPATSDGSPLDAWECAVIAKRTYQIKDDETGEAKTYAYRGSIDALERDLQNNCSKLEKIPEPEPEPYESMVCSVGISLSNRYGERLLLEHKISELHQRLSSRNTFIYDYVSQKYYELKFSSLAEDAFSRIRGSVDNSIGSLVPTGDQKITSIYRNLESDSPEDWSMAVHGCRRVLTALADAVFPPQTEPRCKKVALHYSVWVTDSHLS